MKWFGYIWRVAVNLFYLVVVAAVLFNLRDPSEKSIISVPGLLYVTIRSIAISQGAGIDGSHQCVPAPNRPDTFQGRRHI